MTITRVILLLHFKISSNAVESTIIEILPVTHRIGIKHQNLAVPQQIHWTHRSHAVKLSQKPKQMQIRVPIYLTQGLAITIR